MSRPRRRAELSGSLLYEARGSRKAAKQMEGKKQEEERGVHRRAVILLGMQIRHVARGIVRGFIFLVESLVLNIRFRNTFLSLIKPRLYT